MMDDMVRVFETVGKPRTGILIRLHGETVAPGGPVEIQRDSPAGVLSESLEKLKTQQVWVQRYPNVPEDQLDLWVDERPEN